MQVRQFVLETDVEVVGPTDVPGASGAHAVVSIASCTAAMTWRFLTHAQVVVAAPDAYFRIHPVASRGGQRNAAGTTSDLQEFTLALGEIVSGYPIQI